jgi:hypothetical protein
MYIEFEMLKVKVPIIFLGTVGFSPRRDGRLFHPAYHIERRKRGQCSILLSVFCGGSNPLVLSFLTSCNRPLGGYP